MIVKWSKTGNFDELGSATNDIDIDWAEIAKRSRKRWSKKNRWAPGFMRRLYWKFKTKWAGWWF